VKAVLLWVWFCAYLNCVGWVLSALHQLNAAGYAIALLIWFIALLIWRKKNSDNLFPRIRWQKFRRRFHRSLPLAFLILAAMAFLGGLLYPPANYDALAYRIPRVLHWITVGRWHWIHTIFPSVNTRGCGIEWISAPFIALLKTDRLLFLINIASFLLLPGLIFSVFTRLGVRRRVAWHWMWIIPTGYCFLLQAGSIGNDLFGAPFALAAVDFALRARISKSQRDFFASLLAAALLSSVKVSNLPLLLPWAIALLPSLTLIRRWAVRTTALCVIAFFASFFPTAILNTRYCGDWSGLAPQGIGARKQPGLAAGAESVILIIQNLTPPLFPLTKLWHDNVTRVIPQGLHEQLDKIMESGSAVEAFNIAELQIEENAGLGFGVSALLIISIAAPMFQNRPIKMKRTTSIWQTSVRVAPFVSLLALISNSNLITIGRLVTPYYVLLFPILLAHPAQEQITTRNWWRTLTFAVFAAAAILLIASPPRPLFPVGILLKNIHASAVRHPALARVEEVYSVYRNRWDGFAPAREALPADLKVLGLVTYDDPETSLWRPFGSRRIEHVGPDDTAADLKARGVEYILVKTDVSEHWFGCSLDDWVKRMDAEIVRVVSLNLRASVGPRDWYLLRLQDNP
jgi:hypothetical protein